MITTDTLNTLVERFKVTSLEPEVANMYESDYLFTTLVRNVYTSAPVHMLPDIRATEFKQFKAILHLERYVHNVHDIAGMQETITLLTSYLKSELREFCKVQQTPVYIGFPLIPTCNSEQVINFGFTYRVDGTVV